MSLSIHPRHLLDASHGIRSSIATSDLQQSLNSYRVGQISGWTSLLEFTTAVNRFPCAVSAELGMIATRWRSELTTRSGPTASLRLTPPTLSGWPDRHVAPT